MGWLSRVFRGDARAPRDVDAAFRAALLAVLDRDYDEAEKMLLAAVRLDSDAVEPYLALARLLRRRGELSRAIRYSLPPTEKVSKLENVFFMRVS